MSDLKPQEARCNPYRAVAKGEEQTSEAAKVRLTRPAASCLLAVVAGILLVSEGMTLGGSVDQKGGQPPHAKPPPCEIPYRWTLCPIHGGTYINSMVIEPRRPGTVYACSDIAGLFKSSDYGDHWQVINRGLLELMTLHSVATIALHPRDPQVLYIGVGCNFGNEAPEPPQKGMKTGIYRSADGGRSWEHQSDQVRFCGHGSTRQEGKVLVVDPRNPNVLYAGSAYEGVFKSTDGGKTWTAKGLANHFITTVALDPKNPDTVFVTAAKAYPGKPFESKGGIYRSADRGESWQPLIEDLNVQAFVVNPKDSKVLYAACWDKGVYKSADGGRTWQPKNQGLIPGFGNRRYKAIAIDPVNPNVLYLSSSEEDYRPPVTRFTNLYKSTDAGESWRKIPESTDTNCSSRRGEYCYAPHVNWWGFFPSKDSIAVDPANPKRVFYSSGFGIWRSEDAGQNWQAKSCGLETEGVNWIAVHPRLRGHLYGGHGERGVFRTHDGGRSHSHCPGSPGFTQVGALDASSPVRTILYATDGSGILYRSEDEGLNWQTIASFPVRAIAIRPDTPAVLFAGGEKGLYQSPDHGGNWELLNAGLNPSPAGLVIDPKHPETLYLKHRGEPLPGTPFYRTLLYKSTDGGRSWKPANNGLPQHEHPFASGSPVAIDPNRPEVVYAGYESGLYKSQDSGNSWKLIFPKVFCKAIAVDPRDSSVCIADSAHLWPGWWDREAPQPGLYRSSNGGLTWSRLSDEGIPNFAILSLTVDPHQSGRIYVGTEGNGLVCGEPSKRR